MNRGYPLAAALAAATLLAACAGTDRQACATADWRTVGYDDGVRGLAADRFDNHVETCARHDVTPVRAAYAVGREAGLMVYCQPWRGYGLGLRAAAYADICPPRYAAAFRAAYRDGRRQQTLRAAYDDLDRAVADNGRRLDRLDADLLAKQRQLTAGPRATDDRQAITAEIRALAARRGRLARELPRLEAQLIDADNALAAYQAAMAERYPGGG